MASNQRPATQSNTCRRLVRFSDRVHRSVHPVGGERSLSQTPAFWPARCLDGSDGRPDFLCHFRVHSSGFTKVAEDWPTAFDHLCFGVFQFSRADTHVPEATTLCGIATLRRSRRANRAARAGSPGRFPLARAAHDAGDVGPYYLNGSGPVRMAAAL